MIDKIAETLKVLWDDILKQAVVAVANGTVVVALIAAWLIAAYVIGPVVFVAAFALLVASVVIYFNKLPAEQREMREKIQNIWKTNTDAE